MLPAPPANQHARDRPSHLGLELIHDGALCDLVDLGGREVLNPGHSLRELGDATLQVPPRERCRSTAAPFLSNPAVYDCCTTYDYETRGSAVGGPLQADHLELLSPNSRM
jgi:hypothetical protein